MSFAPRRARSPPNGSRSGLRQEKKRKAPPKPLILGVHSLTNYKIFSRLTAKSRRKALGLGLFGNRRRDNFYEADTLPAGEGVGRPRAASKDARFVLPGRLKSAPRCCILPDPPLDGPLRTARTAGLAWSTNAASPVPQPWRIGRGQASLGADDSSRAHGPPAGTRHGGAYIVESPSRLRSRSR